MMAQAAAGYRAPFNVQFVGEGLGEKVEISIDGGPIESVFAGKLTFKDGVRSEQTMCADVRSPISTGQIFMVQPGPSSGFARVAQAGRIVGMFFAKATTPDQCAGLQLAVWKAIEDGSSFPDFGSGHLQARASRAVMSYAAYFYQAGSAQSGGQGAGGGQTGSTFFQAGGGQGGGGQGQGQLGP